MSWPARRWNAWVALWDHRERPTVLALVRILVGLALLSDLVWIGVYDIAPQIVGPREAGGLGRAAQADGAWLWRFLPPTPDAARAVYAAWVAATVGLTVGALTPWSAAAAALLSANTAVLVPDADRGIDLLLRNALWILALSPCGRVASVDARWRTGSWWGDGSDAPAWPRHLLITQLVVMYAAAGVAKVGARWTPLAGSSALWVILQDPAVSRLAPDPPAWLWWPSRVGTFVTLLWEWSAPLLIAVYLARHLGPRAGAFGRWVRRWRPEWAWAGVGVLFHLGIAVGLDLGVFPWAMLALYPVFLHPNDLGRAVARLRATAALPASHR